MRIAINAMPFSGYGGLTYLRNMLPVLERRKDGHEWFVYGQPATISEIRFRARKVQFKVVGSRGGILGRLAAEHLWLPFLFRGDRIDLVYTHNNTDLFLAPRPRVSAIRYTEPYVYRDYYNSFSKRVRCAVLKFLTNRSLATADHVICVSEYARRLAAGGNACWLSRSSVIHHGCGDPFASSAPKPDWAPPEFLFTSAKMIGYANLHTLVEAYAKCVARGLDLPLFIAGGAHDDNYERTLKQRIGELGLRDKILFLGYIDPESMAGGMAHARVFIFSSLLEACPNTLLEAIGCGAAIVASDTEPNKEVAGGAVAWCDGASAIAMANSIEQVARDGLFRNVLKKRAEQKAREYSWNRTADRLVTVLELVLRRHVSSKQAPAGAEIENRVRHDLR
ncbi:MAG: glycosyltransferase family 4 protein [bacterium]|nr:glycosyltransferase family 4 protein [bacterium]